MLVEILFSNCNNKTQRNQYNLLLLYNQTYLYNFSSFIWKLYNQKEIFKKIDFIIFKFINKRPTLKIEKIQKKPKTYAKFSRKKKPKNFQKLQN